MKRAEYKILLIEDDKIDQIAFRRFAEENDLLSDFTIAGSVAEAKTVLASGRFDVVLLDYLLGDGTAFDIFDLDIGAPIIVITGAGDEGVAVKAMKAGAYDYLVKDSNRNYLKIIPATIERVIRLKSAEDAFRESEEKYRTLTENINVGVYRATGGPEGRFLGANPALVRMFGYESREEIYAIPVAELYQDPEDSGKLNEILLRDRSAKDEELQLKKKDGTPLIGLVSAVAVADERGEVKFYDCVIIDITERKRTEEKLKAINQRLDVTNREIEGLLEDANQKVLTAELGNRELDQISNAAEEGLCVIDNDFSVLRVNETFSTLFGMSNEEAEGKKCSEVLCSHLCNTPRCPLEQILGGEERVECEIEKERNDGVRIPCSLKVTPFRIFSDETTGIIVDIKDISEQRQAEKKQSELINELEKLNKDLVDFTHVAAHDLKTPLRAISTLSKWLSTDYADRLDEEGKEQLDLLTNRAKKMYNLLDGVQHCSEVVRVKEEEGEVNLNTLVSEVIDRVDPPENIEIVMVDQLSTVVYEVKRMEELFLNLLDNAVKYMDKPEGIITIGCTEEAGYWKFSVADNGPGIDEKYHEKIFQMFQTLKSRDMVESTGIGLTVVKKIVEAHGGEIWVESEVGEGCTFYFTVPKAGGEA